MFRETASQRSLFGVEYRLDEVKLARLESSWAQAYRTAALPLIDEKKFARFFDKDNGRPNKSVRMVVSVLLLKEIFNLTDKEALEQLEWSTQWHYGLDVLPEEAHSCQKTLHNFHEEDMEALTSATMGDVNIPGRQPGDPLKLFVSYSPDDAAMKDHLLKHLSPLFFCGRVDAQIQSQSSVPAGLEWRTETETAINQADLALLLISASYMAEPFIMDTELPALLKRRSEGGLVIIPVILRSCLWTEHPSLAGLQPIPRDGKSVAGRDGDAQDEQYMHVARAIAEDFQRCQAAPGRSATSAAHLPPLTGRVRLVHEAKLATPSDEEAHLPALYDGLNEALAVMPMAIGVNSQWRQAPPFFHSKTPWIGPHPYLDQGVFVSFSASNMHPPHECRALLSKSYDLLLEEYIDDGHRTIPAAYVARRITAFIVFARIALRATLGLRPLAAVPMRFKWSLHEVDRAICHCRGWATVPVPFLGDAPTAIAHAPENTRVIATKAHLDKGTPNTVELVGQAVRDLLFRFEVARGVPGRVIPPNDGLLEVVKAVLEASARSP